MKHLIAAWKFARNHDFHPNMGFNHCAIVVGKGGKILSIGFNRYGWTSIQNRKKYSNDKICSVHAEVDALLKLPNREDAQGSTVYVVRVNKSKELAMSAPCSMCEEILREHGVKKAIFSVNENENTFGTMRF